MTSSFPEILVEYGKKDLFSDFCAEQDARNTIHLNVLKYSYMLCDALRQNYIDYSLRSHQRSLDRLQGNTDTGINYHQQQIAELKAGKCDYSFIIESGTKYHKIIMVIDHGPNRMRPSRSVHCFINRKTGEVYKSASWKGPAKGVRYDLRIIEQREWLFENADWAGSYLYAR
jgi:hypothetical protein